MKINAHIALWTEYSTVLVSIILLYIHNTNILNTNHSFKWRSQDFNLRGTKLKDKIESKINLNSINRC